MAHPTQSSNGLIQYPPLTNQSYASRASYSLGDNSLPSDLHILTELARRIASRRSPELIARMLHTLVRAMEPYLSFAKGMNERTVQFKLKEHVFVVDVGDQADGVVKDGTLVDEDCVQTDKRGEKRDENNEDVAGFGAEEQFDATEDYDEDYSTSTRPRLGDLVIGDDEEINTPEQLKSIKRSSTHTYTSLVIPPPKKIRTDKLEDPTTAANRVSYEVTKNNTIATTDFKPDLILVRSRQNYVSETEEADEESALEDASDPSSSINTSETLNEAKSELKHGGAYWHHIKTRLNNITETELEERALFLNPKTRQIFQATQQSQDFSLDPDEALNRLFTSINIKPHSLKLDPNYPVGRGCKRTFYNYEYYYFHLELLHCTKILEAELELSPAAARTEVFAWLRRRCLTDHKPDRNSKSGPGFPGLMRRLTAGARYADLAAIIGKGILLMRWELGPDIVMVCEKDWENLLRCMKNENSRDWLKRMRRKFQMLAVINE